MRQVVSKEIKTLSDDALASLRLKYAHVVVDLGTGDGKFAYHYAKANPDVLVIGVDAAMASMQEISHKASRKPAKGGLENVLFIWAAAEQLPDALTGIAHEIYINFPWGSLLTGVVKAQPEVLSNLQKICHMEARLHVYLSYDAKYEPELLKGLELPELTSEYLTGEWAQAFQKYGFQLQGVKSLDMLEKQQLISSWPKRILSKRDRDVYYAEYAYSP